MEKPTQTKTRNFSHFASAVALWCGRPQAFGLAVSVVLVWAVTGPFFHFSENWQIIINTGTTIITFLMVFVIQSSQNRDGMALQLKLAELIRAMEGARNTFVAAEDMDENDMLQLRSSFKGLAKQSGPKDACVGQAAELLSPNTTAVPQEAKINTALKSKKRKPRGLRIS